MELLKKIEMFLNKDNYKPAVREITYIGSVDDSNNLYVVQQSTHYGINNFCIFATEEERKMMYHDLETLKGSDVSTYLQGRLLIEPFLENDFSNVMELIRRKLPSANLKKFSHFML